MKLLLEIPANDRAFDRSDSGGRGSCAGAGTGFDHAQGRIVASGAEATLRPGDIDTVSPTLGDIHVVRNGLDDQVSISIHLYGGNIGRISRHVFVPGTETVKDFVSGYSNALSPNLWARRLP